MIYIDITRTDKGLIENITMSGHAEYDVPGKDIVCAGVSAVAIGSINAIEALCGVELPVALDNGFLDITIPSSLDESVSNKVQLLLESMLVSFRTIETDYSEYVDILEKEIED
ncbi:ribosomal-processing cysteine protease Prp [Bacillus sp. BGMRC 2118]|nr:ribosomal-processing cysteine protease Prp [Bacillus sp. BGMRC 2118]